MPDYQDGADPAVRAALKHPDVAARLEVAVGLWDRGRALAVDRFPPEYVTALRDVLTLLVRSAWTELGVDDRDERADADDLYARLVNTRADVESCLRSVLQDLR